MIRGSEIIWWGWRIALIVVAFVGAVLLVSAYHAAKYDIREAETLLLSRKIFSCFEKGIEMEECVKINEEYFVNASIGNWSKHIGNADLVVGCELAMKGIKGKLPSCIIQRYLFEGKALDIFVGIRKIEENV